MFLQLPRAGDGGHRLLLGTNPASCNGTQAGLDGAVRRGRVERVYRQLVEDPVGNRDNMRSR